MKLVKTLAAAILMSCAALVGAAEADPPTVIGRLNHISGPVSFAPAQADEDWVAASPNRPLTTGDRLWTDAGGRAEMHVGSLAIRMDALTSLDILNLDDRGLQLRLAQGSANVRVRRATANEPVEIATPGGAVVLARPGSYRMNVDPRGAVTSVAVRGGGRAEVFGQNGSFLVSDGQQATIAGPRPELAASPAPDDFDRWSAARDGREDRVAATRYVPAAMTGYEDLDEYGTWRTVPQYGTVWQPTSVPAGWAPYRHGHWVWIDPWGWTWVDDAPWGFAPSHYGRWIWLGDRWAWAPGRIVAQPVYAPALVAFIGGANFSVSVGVGSAPAVGWVPLGWHEPYRPWYRASHAHVREVNITNVTNVTNITNIANVRHVNRGAPSAVTVVSRETFAGARPVQRAALKVSPRTAAAAPVAVTPSVTAPSAASLAQARPGARPPAEIRTREAVAVSTPRRPDRAALREDGDNRSRAVAGADREHPRVRVIDRRERVNPVQGEPRVAERQAQVSPPPESATARERAAEKADARPREGGERRVPDQPAEVTGRPTFDRSGRMQAAPQPDNRAAQAQDAQRSRGEPQPERQRQADREQAQRQADTRRQVEQRNAQQRQPAQQERDRQSAEEQQAQRQRAEQEHAREQSRQQQAQREVQLRAQEQARQREHAQRAEQQAQQRAQQQAEQRAAQQAQRQAQQHAQEQAGQQQQAQRAEQQAQPQQRQERRDQSHEKGGRERPRGEKAEKG
jgi:hypothetical protein